MFGVCSAGIYHLKKMGKQNKGKAKVSQKQQGVSTRESKKKK